MHRAVHAVSCVCVHVCLVFMLMRLFMFMSPVHACMHCVHSQANKRDYDELPDNLREGITAHFAERYEEVYEIAFAEDD